MFQPHRMFTKSGLAILACAISLVTPTLLKPATKDHQVENEKVVAFLNSNSELRKAFTSRFKGEFRPIPPNLQADLRQAFPMYNFYVAKMEVYLDLPPKEYDLIVLADAKTEEVVAYIWSFYWTLPPSASFERILQGHQAASKEDALNQLKILAQLIAYTNNDKVGKGISESGRIKVELLRGEGVFRILELKIDKTFRLGRLFITAVDGKKPRHFV